MAAWLGVLMVVTLGAQSADPAKRILSTAGRAFVDLDTLVADAARADVVFLGQPGSETDSGEVQLSLLKALAERRRDVILSLDVIDRSAQETVEHFQMGHLSDEAFVSESRMLPGWVSGYLPLLKFAASRNWLIVALGPADRDGEDEMSAAIVQAVTIGSAGGKRPLVVSLHATPDRGVSERAAARARQELPGRHFLILRLVAVPSIERVTSATEVPRSVDYVIYTARP